MTIIDYLRVWERGLAYMRPVDWSAILGGARSRHRPPARRRKQKPRTPTRTR